jgi:hypothetical protein
MRIYRWWIGIAGAAILLAALVWWSERPPRVAPASAPATEFSAARAWPVLAMLADTIEYRVTGTQGADRALAYLTDRVRAIPNVEVEIQDVTRARTFNSGFVRAYRTRNLLVRVPGTSREAVLVSSHYDSPTSSVGASDAGVAVAVMTEMIRALAASPKLPYSVVFNINGAEEQGLLGAHAFLIHPWMQEVRSFIDLESAGTANKAILFQTGPGNPWLAKAYARSAPHPYGTVLGQDIFQSGAIPSATDFEIYRDLANVPGVDIAFFRNGYAYHTQLDRTWNVAPGSLQHMGANALALTRELASRPTPPRSAQRAVYYDILGLKMFTYQDRTANVLALIAAMLAIGAVVLAMRRLVITPRDLLIGALVPFAGWLLGVVVAVGASMIPVVIAGRAHSWYAHSVLPFTAYAALALAPMLALYGWWARRRQSGIPPAWAGALLFFTLLLLLLTFTGVGSGYLLLWWVAPAALGLAILALSGGHRPAVAAAAGFLPGALFTFQAAVLLLEFRTIGGRMLLGVPYDVVMSAIVATVALLLLTLPLTLVLDGGRPGRASLVLTAVGVIALTLGMLRFPYTHFRPQRIVVTHRDLPEGSHLLVGGFDYVGPRQALSGIGGARVDEGGTARLGPYVIDAPPAGYPAPEISQLASASDSASGERTITLKLAPTEAFVQRISLPAARFVRWSISDTSHRRAPSGNEVTAHFVSAPDTGWTVALTVRGAEPVELRLTAVYARTTEPARDLITRLPDWTSAYATAQVRKNLSF